VPTVPGLTQTLTFIVRLWREADAAGKEIWRGRVEHIPSGEVRYVEGAAGVARFLEQWMAPEIGRDAVLSQRQHSGGAR